MESPTRNHAGTAALLAALFGLAGTVYAFATDAGVGFGTLSFVAIPLAVVLGFISRRRKRGSVPNRVALVGFVLGLVLAALWLYIFLSWPST